MKKALEVGQRVKHWFAGFGTVLCVIGKIAEVQWECGCSGIAYTAELTKAAPTSSQQVTRS